MPDVQKDTKASQERAKAGEGEDLGAQVDSLRKVVLLLVVACLAVSVCFNVYVCYDNLMLKEQTATYAQRMRASGEVYQFAQRLVLELRYLSGTNKAVADLLAKHQNLLTTYGLDSQAREAPFGPPPVE